jgi:hypothetical protein
MDNAALGLERFGGILGNQLQNLFQFQRRIDFTADLAKQPEIGYLLAFHGVTSSIEIKIRSETHHKEKHIHYQVVSTKAQPGSFEYMPPLPCGVFINPGCDSITEKTGPPKGKKNLPVFALLCFKPGAMAAFGADITSHRGFTRF